MDPTPSKKLKTSPTTSVPGGTSSNTPQRPSFASPTKSSIARGFPQLSEPSKSSKNPEENDGRKNISSARSSQPPGSPLRNTPIRSTRSGRTPQPAQALQPPEEAEFNPFKPSRTLARDPIVPESSSQLLEEAELNPFKPSRTLARDPIVPANTSTLATQNQVDDRPETSPSPQKSANLRLSPRRSPRLSPGTSVTGGTTQTTEVATPVAEPIPEPVAEHLAVSTVEPSVEPIAKSAAEPNAESIVEPVAEPVQPQPADEQPSATRLEPSATRSDPVRRSPRRSPKLSPAPKTRGTAPITLRVENVEEPELPPTPTQRGLQDPIVTTPPAGIHIPASKSKRPKSRGKSTSVKRSPLKPKAPAPVGLEKQDIPIEKEEVVYTSRYTVKEDKYAAKKKLRDKLLKELKQLQDDVEVAERENNRLHEQQESGRKTLELVGESNLRSIFQRTVVQETKPQSQKSSFQNISAFLPFAGRRRQPAPEISTTPVASHKPIQQENPLPFLKAFTPLTFESTVTILPSVEPATPDYLPDTLQRHIIHASSGNGLLSARTNIVVNTSSHSIFSLEVESLSSQARSELGVFARSCAEKKDAGSLFWALGRWYEVSMRRARFWCAVEKDFGEGMRVIDRSVRRKARGRKRKVVEEEEEEEEGEEEIRWGRKEMLLHLGRRNMILKAKGVELMLQWGIGFDWTGEAESSISADVRILKSWHEGDDRKSLDKIPTTFSRLVERLGPLDAVRTIVALLVKE